MNAAAQIDCDSLTGGSPVYPRPNQPDISESSSGFRQAASTQSGIAYIYIFVQVLLCVITIFITAKFPMNKKEFLIIRKEIARRKGEDDSRITPEEIAVCEKVTGFRYDRLWNKDNALKLK